ncbi:hypothetical protein [Salinibacterium sp.]|uniref:hypothetical protein n=1 Tax=Salinibacterium sp. TaxID=1915057 RepID=UPI00286BBF2C|nr:hypothetical protein [Salinibacterium sp.]
MARTLDETLESSRTASTSGCDGNRRLIDASEQVGLAHNRGHARRLCFCLGTVVLEVQRLESSRLHQTKGLSVEVGVDSGAEIAHRWTDEFL